MSRLSPRDSASRQPPITSKFSSAKPGGSIRAWHDAQLASDRCLASCWRIDVAPRVSGSNAGMSAGGGSGGSPSNRLMTHAPRSTGDEKVPLAVTLSTLAWVSTPPR